MLKLTRKEKRILFLLLVCFLTGVFLYYVKEGELAQGRERIARAPTPQHQARRESKKLKQILREKLDLNKATHSELEALPGIGPKTAQNILDLRKKKRYFFKTDELREVRGIGAKRMRKLSQYVDVR